MYKVICEWDIGINEYIFASFDVAMQHALVNLEACGIEESFNELSDEGLIRIEAVEVIYD